MTQTVAAIYKNGTFRPVGGGDIPLRDGQNVMLTIETQPDGEDILELAGNVYEGLDDSEIDAIEEIAFDRTSFFGDRDQLTK